MKKVWKELRIKIYTDGSVHVMKWMPGIGGGGRIIPARKVNEWLRNEFGLE